MTTLTLAGDGLAVEVDPAAGGRIVSLRDRDGREALWHAAGGRPAAQPPGAAYDPVFAGGWDDLLPNDEPGPWAGRTLADHGELWTTPLDVVAQGPASVALAGRLPACGLEVSKTIAVARDELSIAYAIANPGPAPLDAVLTLHPALRIATGMRLVLPGARALVLDPALSRAAAPFRWPHARDRAGAPLRADVIPAPGPHGEALSLAPIREGRCGLVDPGAGWGVALTFDPAVFGAVHVYASYGAWPGGARFAIVEPSTGWPPGFGRAAAEGRLPRLAPGETLETEVRCRVGAAAHAHRCPEAVV